MQASVEIRPFLAKVKLKMVEFAPSLFNKEPLILAAINVFWVELLLCNDAIKVLLGSNLVHEEIDHNNSAPPCNVAELVDILAKLKNKGTACAGSLANLSCRVAHANLDPPLTTLFPMASHPHFAPLALLPDTHHCRSQLICFCNLAKTWV
jgi:hypothetical protein